MTFKGKYHSKSLKEKEVQVKLVKPELFDLETEETLTPRKNIVRTYSIERTLCEILLSRSECDIQTITYAYKTYSKSKDRNLQKLVELSKIFKVEKKVRSYLEVLI